MKIACVVDSLSRNAGGLFQSVRGLVQSLTEVNGAVTVFGLEDEKTQEDIAQWAPLEVKSFTPSGVLPWGYSNQLLPALLDLSLIHI